MPVLPKKRHELFAQGLAKGLGIGAAYEAAGYKPSPAAATRLSKNVKLQERVAELQAASAERATVTRQWMLERLKENVERCMTAMPVLDREGKPTGRYRYQNNLANKALELLGKALGRFVNRGASRRSPTAHTTAISPCTTPLAFARPPSRWALKGTSLCCSGSASRRTYLEL